jgi:hypothetical protein
MVLISEARFHPQTLKPRAAPLYRGTGGGTGRLAQFITRILGFFSIEEKGEAFEKLASSQNLKDSPDIAPHYHQH